ncbi:SLATT domain-containing protein [Aeromonas caviae]|uniref:SLATT domain-containing protein n=1 Tax=Aeromonas caviae TaxID=648 RepID=UPI001F1A7B4B|nr:SLATT domain-containing protein [Aeromonas caviae]UJQ35624.1 SLATT domain-containing protein [Aeromonas caviae]
MEQNPQIKILEAQVRECYGRVVWTHKTQEKCADLLLKKQDRIKFWQIVLSAITTSGIMVSVFGDSKPIGIISVIISLILTIINAYVKNYDLGGLAQKHSVATASIWNIRENYLSLLTDIKSNSLSIDEIKTTRDQLQADLHKIYKGAPRTIDKAYNAASNALKNMEEMTFNDEEINKLLPAALRK